MLRTVLTGVVVVEVSSLHPHHPGVLHVEVRVKDVDVLSETELVVIDSDPLLSK